MFGGEKTNVRLRVPEQLIGVMIDRFGEDVNIRPDAEYDHCGIINAEVVVSDQFLGWLMGLGEEVEVLAPAGVRKQLFQKGEKLFKKYQS